MMIWKKSPLVLSLFLTLTFFLSHPTQAQVAEIDQSVAKLAGTRTETGPQSEAGSAADMEVENVASISEYEKIKLNSTVTGNISIFDASYWWDPEQKFYRDIYRLEASPGTEITITLTSADVDAFIIIRDLAETTRLHTDNDSGGGTNARLTFVMDTHAVLLDATSYYSGQFGDYTLTVSSENLNTVVHNNETVYDYLGEGDGRLTSERYFDMWSYPGTVQTRITVSVSSSDFQPYIYVLDGPLGAANILGSGYVNGQVEIILPASQSFEILVTTFDQNTSGSYSLSVESEYLTEPVISGRPTTDGAPDPGGKYAVLAGISDYPGINQDIPGAINDVWAMRDVLVFDYGFEWDNVLLILDDDVTRDAIFDAFQTHLSQAGQDGVALFYFSGHGSHAPGNLGLTAPLDPETEDGIDEALLVWGENASTTLLLDDELGFLSDQLVPDRTLIILDSCFSGTGTRAAGAVAKTVNWTELEEEGYASIPEDVVPEENDNLDDREVVRYGDMLIERVATGAVAKGFLSHSADLWEDGVVPYSFDANLADDKRQLFLDAASIWERLTPVSFKESGLEKDYLYVMDLPDSLGAMGINGDSYVGNSIWSDGQSIRFKDGVSLRTYLHEIGHALGLHHEQARFDRDNYIEVRFDRMIDGISHNFQLMGGVSCTEYDFDSVMHYGATAGSREGLPTLVPRPAYSQYAETIGTRATLSDGDIESITRMYTGTCGGGSSEPDEASDENAPVQHLLLYAAENDQQAWSLEELPGADGPMSVFTYHLTNALSENASSLDFESLIDAVSELTQSQVQGLGLSPQSPGIEGRQKRRQLGDYMALDQ